MAKPRHRMPGQRTAHRPSPPPKEKPPREAPDDVPRRKPGPIRQRTTLWTLAFAGEQPIAQTHWRLMLSGLIEIPAQCVVRILQLE